MNVSAIASFINVLEYLSILHTSLFDTIQLRQNPSHVGAGAHISTYTISEIKRTMCMHAKWNAVEDMRCSDVASNI